MLHLVFGLCKCQFVYTRKTSAASPPTTRSIFAVRLGRIPNGHMNPVLFLTLHLHMRLIFILSAIWT